MACNVGARVGWRGAEASLSSVVEVGRAPAGGGEAATAAVASATACSTAAVTAPAAFPTGSAAAPALATAACVALPSGGLAAGTAGSDTTGTGRRPPAGVGSSSLVSLPSGDGVVGMILVGEFVARSPRVAVPRTGAGAAGGLLGVTSTAAFVGAAGELARLLLTLFLRTGELAGLLLACGDAVLRVGTERLAACVGAAGAAGPCAGQAPFRRPVATVGRGQPDMSSSVGIPVPHVSAAAIAPRRLRATLGELSGPGGLGTALRVRNHRGSGAVAQALVAPDVLPGVENCACDRVGRGVDPTWCVPEGVEAAAGDPWAGDTNRRLTVDAVDAGALGEVQVRDEAPYTFCGDERRSSHRSSISKTQVSKEARGAPWAVTSAGSLAAGVSAITARNKARTTECRKGMVNGASRASYLPLTAKARVCSRSTTMRSRMLGRVSTVTPPLSRSGWYSSCCSASRPIANRRAYHLRRSLDCLAVFLSVAIQSPSSAEMRTGVE